MTTTALAERDPIVAATYNNRGNVYAMQGDYDRAIADYDEAIRLDPALASAWHNRGNAYARKGDADRAIADYNEAIRLISASTACKSGSRC
jgi:tetratricopeptide (TPR) repeat protein